MQFFLILVFSIFSLQEIASITYLRPKNDRGPGIGCLKCLNLTVILTTSLLFYQGASHAGFKCIEHVERYFFVNDYSEQVQNLAVFHSQDLTSPAMEIEKGYLWRFHDRILHQEEDEDSFQLKVISEMSEKQSAHELQFTDNALTDFYVLVADNVENVIKFNLRI